MNHRAPLRGTSGSSIPTGAVFLLLAAVVAAPGSLVAIDLDWWTVDGGGGRCAGGGFAVTGTVGQPDATVEPAVGGSFAWSGGLWSGDVTPAAQLPFADGFESGTTSAWSFATGGGSAAAAGDERTARGEPR